MTRIFIPDGNKSPRSDKAAPRGQRTKRTALKSAKPDEVQRQREELFRTIVENSVDGIIIMNSDLEVIYENPASARMLGYEPEKLAGRDPLRIIHPDDMLKLATGFTELIQNTCLTGRSSARVRHKDNSWRLIEAVGVNLLHDTIVKGILLNFRDITDREREEEEQSRNAAVIATAKRCGLTNSEKEVLTLIVEGKSNQQIAERLVTSLSTVKFHVGNILSKMGVTNRIEALALVLQRNLID